MNKTVKTLLLCGGENKGTLFSETSVKYKALLPLAGKSMAAYALDAILKSNISETIAVSGSPDIKNALETAAGGTKTILFLEAKNSMFENTIDGIKALGDCDFVFVMTGDAPLVTGEMIQWFLKECGVISQEADVYWPIIEKRHVLDKFPDAKRTTMKLKEGIFTGGNFALAKPAFFSANEPLFTQAIALRKSPLGLLKLLGLFFVIKFFLGLLSISDIEKRIGEILPGWKAKGVPAPYPEIGMDVDKIEDYRSVSKYVERNAKLS